MATEEINNSSPLYKEFQTLLDKDFKDRKLVANQVINAKVIDILKAHVVVDVRGKSEGMIAISEFKAENISVNTVDNIKCFLIIYLIFLMYLLLPIDLLY